MSSATTSGILPRHRQSQ